MVHIVLYQPEIPSNTGNLIRLSANTGRSLHLIKPLGFSLQSRQLRRAGLDYRDLTSVHIHDDFAACKRFIGDNTRIISFSTHHDHIFSDFRYRVDDALLFGPETRGLPHDLSEAAEEHARLTIPMFPGSRCLNLSNAVSVAVYEAWRQISYAGSTNTGEALD
jgi:tRNA (cytidine/uridine-2'-O-)-methyltransferase